MADQFTEPSNSTNFQNRLPNDVLPKMIASARSFVPSFRNSPPASPSSLPKSSKCVNVWQREFSRKTHAGDRVPKGQEVGAGSSTSELSANAPPPINLLKPFDE